MAAPAFLNPLRRCGLGLALLAASPAIWGQTITPSANDGFDPEVGGSVDVLAVQPNGQILVGGLFSSLKPNGAVTTTARTDLARLNVDGSVDTTFGAQTNGQVTAMLVEPNGQILIGGYFTTVEPNGGAVVSRNHIARLNADGSIDPTFNPDATAALVGQINCFAMEPNGQILIGGAFTSLQPNGAAAASGINRIARLNADGTLDPSFNPNANGQVFAISVQASGQIIIGGAFTTINGVTSNYIARLNADGTLDTTFNPDLNGNCVAIVTETDGKIIIGGSFTTLQPNGASSSYPEQYLARLNTDGTEDLSYNPYPSGPVQSMALQPNGQLIVGGYFVNLQPGTTTTTATDGTVTTTPVNTLEVTYAARVNPDGSADTTFTPNPNYVVNAVAVQPDGKILLGGEFTQLKADEAPAGVTRMGLARVYQDGSLDENFNPDANGAVGCAVVQSDGSIVIGGTFTSVAGVTRNNLARLGPTGALDMTYDPEPNGAVTALALQPNGQLVVGGNFTTIQPNGASSSTTVNYITRLNTDGTQDTSFTTGTNAQVQAITLDGSGNIYIGGQFTVVAGVADDYVARLYSDSALDTSFEPNAGAPVNAILLEPSDNAVIIAGQFTSVTPTVTEVYSSIPYIARLDVTDGALDTTFLPWPNGPVLAMALQSNGQILIAGQFTTLLPGGVPAATTTVEPGNIIVSTSVTNAGVETITTTSSGATTTATVNLYNTCNYIARINSDGSLDTSFNPNANSVAQALALQPNGQILVGGYFSTLQPNGAASASPAVGVARLNTDGSLDTTFSPGVNAQIDTIQVLSGGQVFLGGGFTTIQPTGSSTPVLANHLALLNSNGTLDSGFAVSGVVGGVVTAIAQQPDGHVVIGGSFDNIDGLEATNIARLDADSTFDTSFYANANGTVNAISLQSDGSFIVGGTFSAIGLGTTNNLAHLTSAGAQDTTYTPSPDGPVNAIATVQSSGESLIGGSFSNIGGGTQPLLALLTPVASGGTLDTTFAPSFTGSAVDAVALQANGQILAGGSFTNVDGASCANLVRLNSNGSRDASFNPDPNGTVDAIAVLPNGQILVGGSFTSIGGSSVAYLARLNSNGTVDTSFTPSPNGPVLALSVPANLLNQVYAGGSFTSIGGASISYLALLNSNGSANAAFSPGANGPVDAVAVESDAKLLAGGSFSSIGGQTRSGIARLSTTTGVTQSLTVTNDASVLWIWQGGPTFSQVTFQTSTDDATWTTIGQGTPVLDSNNNPIPGEWQLGGQSLYTGTLNYLQATGIVPTSTNSSSGMLQLQTQF